MTFSRSVIKAHLNFCSFVMVDFYLVVNSSHIVLEKNAYSLVVNDIEGFAIEMEIVTQNWKKKISDEQGYINNL